MHNFQSGFWLSPGAPPQLFTTSQPDFAQTRQYDLFFSGERKGAGNPSCVVQVCQSVA